MCIAHALDMKLKSQNHDLKRKSALLLLSADSSRY